MAQRGSHMIIQPLSLGQLLQLPLWRTVDCKLVRSKLKKRMYILRMTSHDIHDLTKNEACWITS